MAGATCEDKEVPYLMHTEPFGAWYYSVECEKYDTYGVESSAGKEECDSRTREHLYEWHDSKECYPARECVEYDENVVRDASSQILYCFCEYTYNCDTPDDAEERPSEPSREGNEHDGCIGPCDEEKYHGVVYYLESPFPDTLFC